MKGRHRRPGPVGFAAVLAALLVVAAAAVAVRAFAECSPFEPSANAALSKAPEGSGASASPSAAAGSPATERPKRGSLLIHGTGDVSLDPSYIPAFRTQGYGWAWSGLSGLFQRDDLTVINLECPATDVIDPESKPDTTSAWPFGQSGRPLPEPTSSW